MNMTSTFMTQLWINFNQLNILAFFEIKSIKIKVIKEFVPWSDQFLSTLVRLKPILWINTVFNFVLLNFTFRSENNLVY